MHKATYYNSQLILNHRGSLHFSRLAIEIIIWLKIIMVTRLTPPISSMRSYNKVHPLSFLQIKLFCEYVWPVFYEVLHRALFMSFVMQNVIRYS